MFEEETHFVGQSARHIYDVTVTNRRIALSGCQSCNDFIRHLIQAHTYTHARTHTHTRAHVPTHAHTHTQTNTHMHAQTHTHTHAHTRTHRHAHTCTHTHTHTHWSFWRLCPICLPSFFYPIYPWRLSPLPKPDCRWLSHLNLNHLSATMHLKYITVRRSASMMFTMFLYSLSRQLFRLCSAYSSTMPLHHNHHDHYLTQITNIIIVIIICFIIVIIICITISCNCVVLVPVPDR